MRKIIGLLILLVAFVSCEGPMDPEGPMGPQGPSGSGSNVVEGWRNVTMTVKSNDWKLIDNADGNSIYMYEFEWSELTKNVFENGIVLGHLYTKVGDVETLTPLPYVFHRKDKDGNTWTETYTYDYNPGWVAFYATYSDFFVDEKPQEMTFRISILW